MSDLMPRKQLELHEYTMDDWGPDYLQTLPVEYHMNDFFLQSLIELHAYPNLNLHATRHSSSMEAISNLIAGLENGVFTLQLSRRENSGLTWCLDTEETVYTYAMVPAFIPILDHLINMSKDDRNYKYVQDLLGISDSQEYLSMLWLAQKILGINVHENLFLNKLWPKNREHFVTFMHHIDRACSLGSLPDGNPKAMFDEVSIEVIKQIYMNVFKQQMHLSQFTLGHKPTAFFDRGNNGFYISPHILTAFMKYHSVNDRSGVEYIKELTSTFHKK